MHDDSISQNVADLGTIEENNKKKKKPVKGVSLVTTYTKICKPTAC